MLINIKIKEFEKVYIFREKIEEEIKNINFIDINIFKKKDITLEEYNFNRIFNYFNTILWENYENNENNINNLMEDINFMVKNIS
jgi:hypothetical protein